MSTYTKRELFAYLKATAGILAGTVVLALLVLVGLATV